MHFLCQPGRQFALFFPASKRIGDVAAAVHEAAFNFDDAHATVTGGEREINTQTVWIFFCDGLKGGIVVHAQLVGRVALLETAGFNAPEADSKDRHKWSNHNWHITQRVEAGAQAGTGTRIAPNRLMTSMST